MKVCAISTCNSTLYYNHCLVLYYCPAYSSMKNGHVNYKGLKAFHRCNSGYQLFGSKIRTCLPNGRWSGGMPVCISKG